MIFSSKCISEMHAIHCLFWTDVLLTKPICFGRPVISECYLCHTSLF